MSYRTSATVPAIGLVPPLPRDRYTLRIKQASFGISKSSQNPMITWNCEIVSPDKIKVGGVEYPLDTVEVIYYLILIDDKGNLAKIIGPPNPSLMERLGLKNGIDIITPDTNQFEGLCFDAILSAVERKETKPDPENPGRFIPMLDGEGKQITRGWQIQTDITGILGAATPPSNKPY